LDSWKGLVRSVDNTAEAPASVKRYRTSIRAEFLQFRRRMIPKKSKSIFGKDDAQIKVLQRPLRVRRRAAL
jgi:hypothetical protein